MYANTQLDVQLHVHVLVEWKGPNRATLAHQEVEEHAVSPVDHGGSAIGPLHHNLVDLVEQSKIPGHHSLFK